MMMIEGLSVYSACKCPYVNRYTVSNSIEVCLKYRKKQKNEKNTGSAVMGMADVNVNCVHYL